MIEIKNREGEILLCKQGNNLCGANLCDAHLRRADLREADLHGANLRRADLYGANLRGANLCGTDLYDAYLREADLREADLRGAFLHRADLSWTNGAVCLGYDWRGWRFVGIRHIDGWRILAGCRWFTIDEAVKHWTAKNNKDVLARIAILAAHE